jgi:DNA-binding CsgD family transcriptional regulator
MKFETLKPLLPKDFIEKVKVDMVTERKDYKSLFQSEIEQSIRFAVGPFFWFIPDNTQSQIVAVSENIHLQTPHTAKEWLEGDVHFFVSLLHEKDQLYVLSSIQKAMEIFEAMPIERRKNVGLNIYGRMLNAHKKYSWRLIQFPALYFNHSHRVESALLMFTDLSHLGNIAKPMMTIIDSNESGNQFYIVHEDTNELVKTNLPKISIRELQIIRLMASGLTSQEISTKLNLAFYTIENHKRNLRAKTKTKSAAELINYVLMNNLL